MPSKVYRETGQQADPEVDARRAEGARLKPSRPPEGADPQIRRLEFEADEIDVRPVSRDQRDYRSLHRLLLLATRPISVDAAARLVRPAVAVLQPVGAFGQFVRRRARRVDGRPALTRIEGVVNDVIDHARVMLADPYHQRAVVQLFSH